MKQSLNIEPINDEFVAEVHGIDLTQRLDDELIDAIHQNMDRFAVLIFHDQRLDDEHHQAFSEQLGELQLAIGNNVTALEDRRLGVEFSDVSNLNGDSAIYARDDRSRLFGFGNRLWHTDASFRAIPAKYSILSARTVPACGGNTEFADMRAAYDALDESNKRELADLIAEHSLMYSRELLGFNAFTHAERETFAPVQHPMVRTLKSTGRKSLYLAAHAGGIVGWPRPEARAFIFDLIEHATQRQFVYVHEWRVHDLLIWDNRQTMHRVRRFDDLNVERDVRRTTLRCEVAEL